MSHAKRRLTHKLFRDPLVFTSVLLLLAVIVGAVAVPYLSLQPPNAMSIGAEVRLPSREHWLGTDAFGRDNLSQIVWGARVSLMVAVVSVTIAVVVGVGAGVIAGYFGNGIDSLLMRIMDSLLAFPPILLAIALLGALGPGSRNVALGLGVVYTPVFARIARAKTLAIRNLEYVTAAQAVGATDGRILRRYILPNILGPVIVQATVSSAFSIIAEAGMSFLGLGTQPPTPSWGIMLSEARRYMYDQPWFSLVPGLVLALTVLSITIVGDALRDFLDPRQG